MKNVALAVMLFWALTGVDAQVVSGLQATGGKMGEFSEWKKADVSFEDNSSGSIEYRMALVDKKGLGCHYDLEVRNTSSAEIKVRMKSNYYDKLVKSNFGDEIKASVKPGKSVVGRFVGQGCKKDKGAADMEDFEQCMACGLTASIFVSK